MLTVQSLNGVRIQGGLPKISLSAMAKASEALDDVAVLPLKILESQTASTEVRGGQAGGYSSLEYNWVKIAESSTFDALVQPKTVAVPTNTRVRCVARKRYPLAADLAGLFLKTRLGKQLSSDGTLTGNFIPLVFCI
jgi:hypothetical protein